MRAIDWVDFRLRSRLWAALPAGAVVIVTALAIVVPSPNLTPPVNSATSETHRFPLEISPDPVDLGVLPPRESAQATISLRNRGPHPLRVQRIETSGPCLTTTPGPIWIGRGECKVLAVEFDPSEEPDFRGRLAIDVTGYDGDVVAFHTLVELEVRAAALKGTGQLAASPNVEGHP